MGYLEYVLPALILVLEIALIIKIIRSDEAGKSWWITLIVLVPVLGAAVYVGVKTHGERPFWRRPSARPGFEGRV